MCEYRLGKDCSYCYNSGLMLLYVVNPSVCEVDVRHSVELQESLDFVRARRFMGSPFERLLSTGVSRMTRSAKKPKESLFVMPFLPVFVVK